MTQPYSSDLRERVVRAHLAGEPVRQAAARFSVSVSSVPKWVTRPGGEPRVPFLLARDRLDSCGRQLLTDRGRWIRISLEVPPSRNRNMVRVTQWRALCCVLGDRSPQCPPSTSGTELEARRNASL